MAKRVEIEKKFYCNNLEKLSNLIIENNFILTETGFESDEYFTDIDSIFVENRTCLRIRKTDDKKMELTFKGKSKELSNFYAKMENNISLDIGEYNDILGFLSSLGYYSYSIVNKKRSTYSYKDNNLTYNIMIDQIEELGNFVEFEILSIDDSFDFNFLKNQLDNLVKKFDSMNFISADLPYRDFVANSIYKKILPSNKLTTVFFDLDGTLINSEVAFFESFKKVLKENYDVEITINEYKQYELQKNAKLISYLKENKRLSNEIEYEEIINLVYKEYEDKFQNLILKPESILNFELLKRLKKKNIKLGLVTTSKKKFVNILIDTLKIEDLFDVIISRDDVTNLKPDSEAYLKALDFVKEDSSNCIAIEDSSRGIDAAIASNLKTIKVNNFNIEKKDDERVLNVDSVSRIIFFLLNQIK